MIPVNKSEWISPCSRKDGRGEFRNLILIKRLLNKENNMEENDHTHTNF